MTESDPIIYAYRLRGDGSAEQLDSDFSMSEQGDPIWVHLDAVSEISGEWLKRETNLGSYVIDGLLAEESRPRCDVYPHGVLIVLRGVNLNPGSDPEDMVSIRIWMDHERVITTRFRRIMAVEDIVDQLEKGQGPTSTSHLVARLGFQLTERMGPFISQIDEEISELEDVLIAADHEQNIDFRETRSELLRLRRLTIALRRFLAPQRIALATLAGVERNWISPSVMGRLREVSDRVTRITEDLDEARERCVVIYDELSGRMSHRMERTMYLLTVVATIMLPLGFLTGLLGINVAGIPGAESKSAFWVVCALMGVLVAAEVWFFRKKKWI